MKQLFFMIAFAAATQFGSAADALLPATTNKPTVIEIVSEDGFEYDFNQGQAVYQGNVVVRDTQMVITCRTLTVRFTSSTNKEAARLERPVISNLGGKVASIVADGDVVIINLQDKSEAKGEKAVYTAGAETVILTGKPATPDSPRIRPSIHSGANFIKADTIIFDRLKGKFRGTGNIESGFDQSAVPGGGLFNTTTQPTPIRRLQ